jgi:hypothetical protein
MKPVAEHHKAAREGAGGPAPSGIFAIEGGAEICKQNEACVARGMVFPRELRWLRASGSEILQERTAEILQKAERKL